MFRAKVLALLALDPIDRKHYSIMVEIKIVAPENQSPIQAVHCFVIEILDLIRYSYDSYTLGANDHKQQDLLGPQSGALQSGGLQSPNYMIWTWRCTH